MIKHMKMTQIPYLDTCSMLLSGNRRILGGFFSVPLEIPGKTKLHPWKFGKIKLSLGLFKAKNQGPWKYYMNFSWYPLMKFHFVFNQPLEILHVLSLIPPEIIYPQPTPHTLFGTAQSGSPCASSNTFV